MSSQMTADFIEVFRSLDRAQCDDRAFMLSAVSIACVVDAATSGYVVRVPYAQAAFASHHLWQYEQEIHRRPRAVLPPAPVYPHAWVGSALYVALLALVAMMVVRGWWRPDTFAIGMLDSGAVQSGQWWRAFTALTLHVDIVHLMMNLGAGAAIGLLASRQIGAGSAWLLTVLAAGLANLVEGLFSLPGHESVGASTAVFAALGLLAAHSWRTRSAGASSRLRHWAPLIAGAALLGLMGTEGEGTDLVAHLLGFTFGMGFGALAAQRQVAATLLRLPQWLSGVLAIGTIGCCWMLALAT
jgi:rhomboid protease GluP